MFPDAIMDSNETSKPCENVEFEEEKLELIPEEHSESFVEEYADVESDETSKACENVDFEEKQLELIREDNSKSFVEDNADVESDETSKACENVYFEEEKDDLIPEEHSESFVEDNADVEFVEKSKPCETVDFEGCSSIEEKNQHSPNPTTLFDLISHPTPAHPTSRRKTPATSTRRKEGEKMEWCTPGIATVRSSRRKVATTPSTTMKKEGTLQKEFSSRRSTRLTEKKSEKSTVKSQSENVMNFEEVFPEVSENAIDAGRKKFTNS